MDPAFRLSARGTGFGLMANPNETGLGIVAAGHPAVAAAGRTILEAGGNAFDALVACGFVSCVVEIGFASLAGGGYMVARPAGAEPVFCDFFVNHPGLGGSVAPEGSFAEVLVQFPSAVQPFHCGPASVAVPGCLDGLLTVLRRWGRLDPASVVEPARRLAATGVEVSSLQAKVLGLLAPIVVRTEACRRLLAPAGRVLVAGDHYRNEALAGFLSDIGSGAVSGWGSGAARTALLSTVGTGHGLLTSEDVDAYEVAASPAAAAAFADHRVFVAAGSSFGGPLVAAALRRWDETVGVGAALDAVAVGVQRWVDERRGELLAGFADSVGTARGTTHISVADSDGNVAAMTLSNGECSGDVIEGTGVLCNNMLGEDDLHPDGFHAGVPGTRVGSMMSPLVVLDFAGSCVGALGSGGSKRIRSALVQVVARHLVGGESWSDAVAAPRVHAEDGVIQCEPGVDAAALAAASGMAVNQWAERDMYFGGVHVVEPGVGGVGDGRREGSVAVSDQGRGASPSVPSAG